MWGDPDNADRLSALLSIILDIPYETLKGKVEVIESEKRITRKDEKVQRYDVLAKVNLNFLGKVNLEMNIGFDSTDIDRNTSYISHIFSSNIRSGEDYSELETVIQINFNDYEVSRQNNKIINKYYFKNDNGEKLTEKLQIYHINIEKCKDIWYSGDINKYNNLERQVIRICTLMTLTDIEEFETCLKEIDMDEFVKKDIEQIERMISADNEILSYYGSEEDMRKLAQGKLKNATRKAEKEGFDRGFNNGFNDGSNQTKIEIVKNMLSKNIDINLISEVTGMTVVEITNISNV